MEEFWSRHRVKKSRFRHSREVWKVRGLLFNGSALFCLFVCLFEVGLYKVLMHSHSITTADGDQRCHFQGKEVDAAFMWCWKNWINDFPTVKIHMNGFDFCLIFRYTHFSSKMWKQSSAECKCIILHSEAQTYKLCNTEQNTLLNRVRLYSSTMYILEDLTKSFF